MTDAAANDRAAGPGGAGEHVGTRHDGEPAGSESTAQMERELRAANAAIAIKNEYIAQLEHQLDAKTAYIDALPSLRLKLWLKGLWPRQGS